MRITSVKLKQRVKDVKDQVERQPGSIVAGPVVVEGPGDEHGLRIFVAVAHQVIARMAGFVPTPSSNWRCRNSDWHIDAPVSVTLMPIFPFRAVRPLGRCELSARGCEAFSQPLFAGNYDLIIDLDWRVDHTHREHQVWLQNGSWTDSVVFTGNSMVRVRKGGFVESPESHAYRFLIAITHAAFEALCGVAASRAFCGKNCTTEDKSQAHYVRRRQRNVGIARPYPLAMSALELRGGNLVIVLDENESRRSLEFDLSSIVTGTNAAE